MQSDPFGQPPPGQSPPSQAPPGAYPPGIGSPPGSGYAPTGYPPQALVSFTFEERAVVRGVARLAMIGAWLSIVANAVGLVVNFFQTVNTPGAGPGGMFSGLLSAGIGVALAALLIGASKKLASFASAETPNVWDLVSGFESLRVYFKVTGVIFIVAMVIMGLGILLAMCVAVAGVG